MKLKTFLSVAVALAGLGQARAASAIERQQADNWCWAASVQDVVEEAGIPVSQADVVDRLTGWPQDRPATIGEVVQLVQSYGLTAWRAGRPGSPAELYSPLENGWKIIAFATPSAGPVGHFIVLEGIGPDGGIEVSDPGTGSTEEQSAATLYAGWRWGDSVVVGRRWRGARGETCESGGSPSIAPHYVSQPRIVYRTQFETQTVPVTRWTPWGYRTFFVQTQVPVQVPVTVYE